MSRRAFEPAARQLEHGFEPPTSGRRAPTHRPHHRPHHRPTDRARSLAGWYRAPEVLLGAPCAYAADAWSVGCVVAEVALGVPVLPGESEYNQLARIVSMLGPPPAALLHRGRRSRDFFVESPRPDRAAAERAADGGRGAPASSDEPRWGLRLELAAEQPELVRYLPQPEIEPLVRATLTSLSAEETDALLLVLDALLQWDPAVRWPVALVMRRLRSALEAVGDGELCELHLSPLADPPMA